MDARLLHSGMTNYAKFAVFKKMHGNKVKIENHKSKIEKRKARIAHFERLRRALMLSAFLCVSAAGQVSLSIAPGSTLTVSGEPQMILSGNWSNPGNFLPGQGVVVFNGPAAQSLMNLSPQGFYHLTVEKSGDLALNGPLLIQQRLEVISGDLELNGNSITLAAGAMLSETPGNTVKGAAGSISITRTLNAPSEVDAGGLGATITSNQNLGATTITRWHDTRLVNGNTSIRRSYEIIPQNNFNLNATLAFKYDESELNGTPESDLKLFRSADNGQSWAFAGGSVNPALNVITLSGIDAFSLWTAVGVDCLPGILGDVNGDGAANSGDGLILLSYDVGLAIPPAILERINAGFGDVNGDGSSNSTDALIILSQDVGFPVPFPVGQLVCL